MAYNAACARTRLVVGAPTVGASRGDPPTNSATVATTRRRGVGRVAFRAACRVTDANQGPGLARAVDERAFGGAPGVRRVVESTSPAGYGPSKGLRSCRISSRARPSIVTTFPNPHIVSTVTSADAVHAAVTPAARRRRRSYDFGTILSNVDKDASEKARTGASSDITSLRSFRKAGSSSLFSSKV